MSGRVPSYLAKPQIAYEEWKWWNHSAGLVSTTITDVTKGWGSQLVDIVGATILYFNVEWSVTTASRNVNAHFSCGNALSHGRMTTFQPGRVVCITSVPRWAFRPHFCSCSSSETIPAIDPVVTFPLWRFNCYVVIFSWSIFQSVVILAYVS